MPDSIDDAQDAAECFRLACIAKAQSVELKGEQLVIKGVVCCEDCEEPIAPARLAKVPKATRCTACQEEAEAKVGAKVGAMAYVDRNHANTHNIKRPQTQGTG